MIPPHQEIDFLLEATWETLGKLKFPRVTLGVPGSPELSWVPWGSLGALRIMANPKDTGGYHRLPQSLEQSGYKISSALLDSLMSVLSPQLVPFHSTGLS